MLHSMTGYGRHAITTDEFRITVEIRSLNSKFLEIHPKVPGLFRSKEADIRSMLSKLCTRGKVEMGIHYQWLGTSQLQSINTELIQAYLAEFKQAAKGFDINDSTLFSAALRMPNTTFSPEEVLPEHLWESFLAAYEEAAKMFTEFRAREGKIVDEDFTKWVTSIHNNLNTIAEIDGQRIEEKKEKLRTALEQLEDKSSIDENRFEQELIYYIEKIDLSEEKSRLAEHCTYFLELLQQEAVEKGKKLNFVTQEMGREINTIGSKANSSAIQRLVVEMKDELEKIKEQTANIV